MRGSRREEGGGGRRGRVMGEQVGLLCMSST